MIDEELYRRAAEELNSGNRRAHLWARACSLASDDHDEARFLYTNLRVEELLAERDEAQFQEEQADDNSLSHIASVDDLELEAVEFDDLTPSEPGIESTRTGESGDIDAQSALSEADLDEFERDTKALSELDELELSAAPSKRDLARLELYEDDEVGLEPDDVERMNLAQPTPVSSLDGNELPDTEIDQQVDQIAAALEHDLDGSGDPHDFTNDFDLDEVMGTGAIDQAVAEAGIEATEIDAELNSIEMALDADDFGEFAADPEPVVEPHAETSKDDLKFDDVTDAADAREEILEFPVADDLFAEVAFNEAAGHQDAPPDLEESPIGAVDSREASLTDIATPESTSKSEAVASQDPVDELLADLAAESERRNPKDDIDAGAGIPVSHSASYTADLDWIDDVVRSDDGTQNLPVGTQPVGTQDVPVVAKRIEPNIPAPAVGGMITGTLDAGGYRTYSLFARADGHWQAVNQGVSLSALGLTLPWLLYRKLYVNALIYALLWIVSLTGLVITGLAWLDNPGLGFSFIPLLTVGFGFVAFLGLLFVPFRHANKWRMAKLTERGFEKVGEVQSLNSGRALKVMQNQLAMARQRH